MKSAKNVISNISTRIVMFPLSFASSVVVARVLGAEGKGIYAYILVLSSILIPLLSLGFTQGLRYYTASKQYAVKDSSFTVFINAILFSFIISLILIFLWKNNYLGESAQDFVPGYIVLLTVLVLFKTIILFFQGLLNSDGQFIFNNRQNILNGVVTPLLIILFVFIFEDKVLGTVSATCIALLVLVINILFFTKRKYNPNLILNRPFVKDSYKYGIKGWFGYVAINANTRLDRFLLGLSSSARNLGNYSVATSLSELIWIFPDSVGPIFFNQVAELKDRTKQLNLLVKINRLLIFASVLIGVFFMLVIAKLIPLIYGDDYIDSVLPFIILVPGTVVMVLSKNLTKLFAGTGNIAYSTVTQVGGASLTIALCIILIPTHGILGAAVASSIGYTLTSLIAVYIYKKKYSGSIRALLFLKAEDIVWLKGQINSIIKTK